MCPSRIIHIQVAFWNKNYFILARNKFSVKIEIEPWLVWLSGLDIVPQIDVSLPLFLSLPSLKINKIFSKKR